MAWLFLGSLGGGKPLRGPPDLPKHWAPEETDQRSWDTCLKPQSRGGANPGLLTPDSSPSLQLSPTTSLGSMFKNVADSSRGIFHSQDCTSLDQWFSTLVGYTSGSSGECKKKKTLQQQQAPLQRFWFKLLWDGAQAPSIFIAPLVILKCTWAWELLLPRLQASQRQNMHSPCN